MIEAVLALILAAWIGSMEKRLYSLRKDIAKDLDARYELVIEKQKILQEDIERLESKIDMLITIQLNRSSAFDNGKK